MQKFEANLAIKKFLKNFFSLIQKKRENCWYRVCGTDVQICSQRIEYRGDLAMYIVLAPHIHTYTVLNSMVMQTLDELPFIALYDRDSYIVTEDSNKIHKFKRTDYPSFSTDDIFSISTLGECSVDSLNSLLLLSDVMQEYKLDAVEFRIDTLLSILYDHPELIENEWVVEEIKDE